MLSGWRYAVIVVVVYQVSAVVIAIDSDAEKLNVLAVIMRAQAPNGI